MGGKPIRKPGDEPNQPKVFKTPINWRALVRLRMKYLKVSQAELAQAADISASALSRWLQGKTDIGADKLSLVLLVLGSRLNYILNYEDAPLYRSIPLTGANKYIWSALPRKQMLDRIQEQAAGSEDRQALANLSKRYEKETARFLAIVADHIDDLEARSAVGFVQVEILKLRDCTGSRFKIINSEMEHILDLIARAESIIESRQDSP